MDDSIERPIMAMSPNSRDSDTKNKDRSAAMESILKMVGGFGRWQWYMWLVTSSAGIFAAYNNLSAAFLAASPDFWCRHPGLDHIPNVTDLLKTQDPSHVVFPQCGFYNASYEDLEDYLRTGTSPKEDGIDLLDCSTGWLYDTSEFESTIVTEWNLVCGKKWLMSNVQSSSVFGFLAGGIVISELSDIYGRRTLSLVSTVGLTFTGVIVAFANSYELFIFIRFFMSFFAAGVFLPNFVLLMESSGDKARTYLGIMYQFIFGLGVTLVAANAYYFRSWRQLELALFIPCTILLVYFKILPESPLWLLENGRREEAAKVLRHIAKGNNKIINEAEFQKHLDKFNKGGAKSHNILKVIGLFFLNQFKLFKTPILRRRCILIFFEWFVVGMVYYGLVFNSPNLKASRFILVAASGFSEALSVVVVSFTTEKLGRKWNLLGLLVICGLACIGILLVPRELVWLNITLSTIGKFVNAAAFAVVYIYSAELVPTSVRNIAVGGSSMWARVGSMSAPFIVDLLGDLHYTIPSTLFGILSIVAGAAALLLPETGGKSLPNSIEDVESQEK